MTPERLNFLRHTVERLGFLSAESSEELLSYIESEDMYVQLTDRINCLDNDLLRAEKHILALEEEIVQLQEDNDLLEAKNQILKIHLNA